jgi:hypothetical protein
VTRRSRPAPSDLPDDRPSRLELVPADQRHGTGGKVIGVANAGPPARVGISLQDCLHHLHVLGPTGTGKTSLLLRMVLDDVAAGRGVAVFDPSKGDLIRDLLDRLPASCGRRLVLIDPDETDAPPAINLLDPQTAGASPYDVAAQISSVMSKVWSRWWGHRTADVAHHALLTLAHLPGATLAQLPRLLSDPQWRARQVRAVIGRLGAGQAGTLGEFWDGFDSLPPGHRATLVAPLLAKLRLVLTHPLAAGLFGVPATTFRLADILDGAILLVRLPKGVVGEDGCRLIGSLLLAGLWQAATARARLPEADRRDCAIVVDECHNLLHLPIGIDDALAEARGLHTGFVLAHQYLGQLTSEMHQALDANARNKLYFALAPRDATDQAHHVTPWLDDGDLTRLGGYEVVLRPVAGGRIIPPVTADTLPPPPPIPGRAEALRAAARTHTGLPQHTRRRLHGEVATRDTDTTTHSLTGSVTGSVADSAAEPAMEWGTSLLGSNTFSTNSRAENSRENSDERSPTHSTSPEHPGQQPPPYPVYPLVDDEEDQPWTGTD